MNTEMDFTDLMSVISFAGFSFAEYYKHEETILKPRLEELGYSNVRFVMGERDSFGPLSRIVYATKNGQTVKFIYG